MGLDQYAYAITKKYQDKNEEFISMPKGTEDERLLRDDFYTRHVAPHIEEIQYWRKHSNLNGWMARLAASKGVVSSPDEFNCVYLVLDKEDIDNLEEIVTGAGLPDARGFFWGETHPDDTEDDLKFIKRCRQQFKMGNGILYYCWW
jgi:hypothetical protein